MAPPPMSLPELALPEDALRTRPANATLLVLIHTRPISPLRPPNAKPKRALRRSVSQRGGASLRRIFVKCGLSPGRYEAADYVRKCSLISAQPTVIIRGSAVRMNRLRAPASAASNRVSTRATSSSARRSTIKIIASRKLMVDAYRLRRLDFIKLGIAAMELEALEGASQTIERCRPIMLIETIKTDGTQLRRWLEQPRYCVIDTGINVVAIHANDRSLDDIAPQAPLKPSPGVSLTAIRPAASGRAPRLSARAIARARRSRS